ncbi:hypothetical protein [Nocardia brasiliensis]|uniref:hypothetical protein n=1 Tax=Nocardia brasiliensis TaxID=37326 RepID=UPI00366FC42F
MSVITENLPAVLAGLSAVVAALYARRSQRESNRSADWQAFVKSQAELLIKPLREELDKAKADIAELKTKLSRREGDLARTQFQLREAVAYIRVLLAVLADRRARIPRVPESIEKQVEDGI